MKTVGKLTAVVGLNTSDGEREKEDHLFEKLDRGVAANLIKDHLKLQSAVFVNS